MKKRIQAMAEGKFDYREIDVHTSVQRIEWMAKKNEVLRGSFVLESSDERKLKGLIYTSNRRMKCKDVQFIGRKVQILYEFHTAGLEEGETSKGEICIESNAGEIVVPYVVSISHYSLDSSVGKIKNLFHFANLAQKNYQEAYKLFCSKKFLHIEMEESYRTLYEALTAGNICRENMEEFLIAIHKKEPIRFILNANEQFYECEGGSFKKDIVLSKNTWGHVAIKISADADFIRIDKPEVTTQDFVGNHYTWEFIVDQDKLHAGKNCAVITFSSGTQTEHLKVEIGMHEDHDASRMQIKQMLVKLLQQYIRVRSHQMKEAVWIKESLAMAETLNGLVADKPDYMLFLAQMYAMAGKETEGFFLIHKFEDIQLLKRNNPSVYAYYQYVLALLRRDEEFNQLVKRELIELSKEHPDNFRILALRLFLDKELESSPLMKYRMLKLQYSYGCRSPLLYLEAALLMQRELGVLGRLEDFEIQVLAFASKYGLLTAEVVEKTADLTLRLKQFEPVLLRCLTGAYEQFPSDICVEAICSMLIRANRRSSRYFEWFKKGVEADLKLTQLFEYYLYTIPVQTEELLPKTLLLYFNFDSTLDYKRKAYLYANIWKHKLELGELFDSYEPRIRLFTAEQILNRHINHDLAYLYQQLSKEILNNEETSAAFEEMVFVRELTCDNPNIRHVIVRHPGLNKEELFPISEGRAWIRCYMDQAWILLEDKEGHRHVDSVDYETKELFKPADVARFSLRFKKVKLGLLLNRYEKAGHVLQEPGSRIVQKLLQKTEVQESYRQKMMQQLIEFYMEERHYEQAQEYLLKLQLSYMDSQTRAHFIEMMITRGLYQKAYDSVLLYGTEKIEPKRLVRLCSRLIEMDEPQEELLELCEDVFKRGKYDEVILEYLTRYFYGPTAVMQRVWRAAHDFEMDTYQIGERILVQMLFTGHILAGSGAIFEDYYRPGFKTEIVRAYLAFFAYYYVVHDQIIDEKILHWIERACRIGEQVNDDCKIALLKHYAAMKQVPDDKVEFLQELMAVFVEKDMIFPFFVHMDPKVGNLFHMSERTIVQHRASEDARVFIAYRMSDIHTPGEYKREEMTQIYQSLFVKELITFYGERIQYYIMETDADGTDEKIVTSAVLENEQEDEPEVEGRFHLLNDMSISYELKDEETLHALMYKYGQLENLADGLFELQE